MYKGQKKKKNKCVYGIKTEGLEDTSDHNIEKYIQDKVFRGGDIPDSFFLKPLNLKPVCLKSYLKNPFLEIKEIHGSNESINEKILKK